jgi:hypothetical protein
MHACSANKDQYDPFIIKACKVLGMKAKKGKRLHLFKPGRGALIPSCTDDGSCWTLGRYIRETHTSADKVVLGVGYTTDCSSRAVGRKKTSTANVGPELELEVMRVASWWEGPLHLGGLGACSPRKFWGF